MDAEDRTNGFEGSTSRPIPRGISRLIAYARGKEILVVGPSSAGKTKFAEYLRLGVLDQEGERQMTYHVHKSPAFAVEIGQGVKLNMQVRRAVDTPGQTGPVQHANLVGRRKPHLVVVMVDCSKRRAAMLKWLRLFCDRLDTILRKGSYADKKLNDIAVILNKRDKIDSKEADELKDEVKKVLLEFLSIVLGRKRVRCIPILECISVQNPQGTGPIDDVIQEMAQRLGRGRLRNDAPP